MNPNVYSLWSQTPLSLGYITKACSLIGQFTCTFQKLCLEMAFFKNFKYVFWRLQTRCLKFENCFGITGLILLKWDTVQHDPSLGEKVEFPLVTDLWPKKHVVCRPFSDQFGQKKSEFWLFLQMQTIHFLSVSLATTWNPARPQLSLGQGYYCIHIHVSVSVCLTRQAYLSLKSHSHSFNQKTSLTKSI